LEPGQLQKPALHKNDPLIELYKPVLMRLPAEKYYGIKMTTLEMTKKRPTWVWHCSAAAL